jgi:hypothetical protein
LTPASRLFDAIVLYAHGAMRVINSSGDARNGTAVVEAMLSASFAGETGTVQLDSNGDLVESYSVFNYVAQNGTLRSVLVGECAGLSSGGADCAITHDIRWPGGSTCLPTSKYCVPAATRKPPRHCTACARVCSNAAPIVPPGAVCALFRLRARHARLRITAVHRCTQPLGALALRRDGRNGDSNRRALSR